MRALLRGRRFTVRSLLVTPRRLAELAPWIEGRAFPVYRVEPALLRSVADARFAQMCVAVGEFPPGSAADLVAADLVVRARSLLVLERVVKPDNVGSAFRNARAFGAEGVWLSPGCAHPLYRQANRTSMGASLEVPFVCANAWPEPLRRLREAGFTLVALTPAADAIDIAEFVQGREPWLRTALVLGGEGYGLSDSALALCHARVRIPMAPGVDSINVSSAAAIALHRLLGNPQPSMPPRGSGIEL